MNLYDRYCFFVTKMEPLVVVLVILLLIFAGLSGKNKFQSVAEARLSLLVWGPTFSLEVPSFLYQIPLGL